MDRGKLTGLFLSIQFELDNEFPADIVDFVAFHQSRPTSLLPVALLQLRINVVA